MYWLLKGIEKIIERIKCKIKIIYLKLKYGKRIKIGKKVIFRKSVTINISNLGVLEIGDNCFFNNYCSINCHEKITIGKNNLFGENVKIYDHNHVFNEKNIDKRYCFKSNPIKIGDNCWFGSNVVLLSKCNIKNDCVVGAGTVVNEEFNSNLIIKGTNDLETKEINFK